MSRRLRRKQAQSSKQGSVSRYLRIQKHLCVRLDSCLRSIASRGYQHTL